MVASELKEKVSRLILLYPALCIPDDAGAGKMLFFKFDTKNIPEKIGFGPLTLSGKYARDVIHTNSYDEIKDYHGPVLLIHGEKDNIVNISYAYKAKEIYGHNCTMHALSQAGHGFKKKDDHLALPMIEQFINY